MRQNGEGSPAPDEIRRRAISLYTFLKEFAELRAETIRSVERYDQVLWLEDVPREPECYCAAWHDRRDDESEAWIEVRKPRLNAPPVPPAPLRSWLTESEWQTSESELPSLREQIILASPAEDEAPQQLELSQSPDIRGLWERYVETEWWPWREEDRRSRVPVMAGTDNIGSIHDELAALVDAGMPPVDALRAATVQPARFLNAATLSGLVKPGYRADFVLLKANPLVDISNTRGVVGVVLGGKYRKIVAAISEAR